MKNNIVIKTENLNVVNVSAYSVFFARKQISIVIIVEITIATLLLINFLLLVNILSANSVVSL